MLSKLLIRLKCEPYRFISSLVSSCISSTWCKSCKTSLIVAEKWAQQGRGIADSPEWAGAALLWTWGHTTSCWTRAWIPTRPGRRPCPRSRPTWCTASGGRTSWQAHLATPPIARSPKSSKQPTSNTAYRLRLPWDCRWGNEDENRRYSALLKDPAARTLARIPHCCVPTLHQFFGDYSIIPGMLSCPHGGDGE